jgi:hypothetical protein
MKTDLYTKSVLTVIAGCLAVIALKEVDIIPTAKAAATGFNNSRYGLVPLNSDGTIDVNIKSSTSNVKVSIEDINTYDKLPVNIEEVDCYAFSSCTIPVKIKQ